jgi:hypothetical protein
MKSLITALLFLMAFQAFAQKQGVCGKVTWIAGNQMPGPDREIQKPQPVARVIHVFEATHSSQAVMENGLYKEIKTKLITTGKSDSAGQFKINLEPGEYSIFVKEAEGWFANSYDDSGRIHTVTVAPKKYTELNILVNYLAVY